MISKNLPKHVMVVRHPDYRCTTLYFMTVGNVIGRSLRLVHENHLKDQNGNSRKHKFQDHDMKDEKAKKQKLNEAVLESVPDLKVYS
ncbi:unnamed protein product [Ambrosiozyma monospora]|uniref:Unnamed protein product n=1 Tax=Ambrosiozyma monospora TaxID=43982 RepID=A0ACB5U4K9_AMBMO|nr:unnamed protein product [Ambrosiozyma monospora]